MLGNTQRRTPEMDLDSLRLKDVALFLDLAKRAEREAIQGENAG
mgnify:CR=1 FL=1